MTQERLEMLAFYLIAKPVAWLLWWLWLGLCHSLSGIGRCVTWVGQRWSAWRASRIENAALANPRMSPKGNRVVKRETAVKA
jgi:uncharacterized membrane protein YccF (DUF307 family)